MRFTVKPYVDDRELEKALNKVLDEGGEIYQLYRNTTDSNGNENCTIVYLKEGVSPEAERRLERFRQSHEKAIKTLLQTGNDWARSLDLWIEPTGWKGDAFFKEFVHFDEFVDRCFKSAQVLLGGGSEKEEKKSDSEGAGQGVESVDTPERRE